MRTENNGKIAIAIVSMFVIALSVVGFTYAYFTAQVRGNTATKSVEETAGRLEVLYEQGNLIKANNIVPGWISDGIHYYDPIYSGTTSNGVNYITAVKTDDTVTCRDGSGTNVTITSCTDAVSSPAWTDGIATPIKIRVTNTNNNTADNDFVIRLNVSTNDFGSTDSSNLKVTVKNATVSNNTWTAGSVVWSGPLAQEGDTQIIVPNAETLTASNSTGKYYLVYLTYVNVNTSQNDSSDPTMNSTGSTVVATADIIGIAENQKNSGNWYDSDGEPVTFPGHEDDPSNPGTELSQYIDYTDYTNHNNGI